MNRCRGPTQAVSMVWIWFDNEKPLPKWHPRQWHEIWRSSIICLLDRCCGGLSQFRWWRCWKLESCNERELLPPATTAKPRTRRKPADDNRRNGWRLSRPYVQAAHARRMKLVTKSATIMRSQTQKAIREWLEVWNFDFMKFELPGNRTLRYAKEYCLVFALTSAPSWPSEPEGTRSRQFKPGGVTLKQLHAWKEVKGAVSGRVAPEAGTIHPFLI